MELFLIRHAESRNNVRKSDDERFADPELTSNGLLQSDHVAKFLQKGLHLTKEEHEANGKVLDQLYCSAMMRALQTAFPIGVATGLKPEVWLDIHETEGLYNWNSDHTKRIGIPGMNRAEIHHRFPEYVLPDDLGDSGWWNRDAETRIETFERVERILHTIMARAEENIRLGMITHGAFMSIFLCKLFKLTPGQGIAFQSHNCSVSRITFEKEGRITIQYLNFFGFLPENLRVPRPECDI